ncbi:hypothetical protein [Cumulibacter manganitolerans]|uniref:hypothetical protein n=1 Tax=Cumulibacter manganitolerans TaxID=1884992 RepID=UPI0012978B5F|nr:hypothetical protein [Cumulibacter manganitolerans]
MRWDRLLADLAALEEARARGEMLGEAAERGRLETARVALENRLSAAVGGELTVAVEGGQRCSGRVEAAGDGWLLLRSGPAAWLVATAHLVWVANLPRHTVPAPDGAAAAIHRGLGLRHVLRGVAADRSAVQLGLGSNAPVSGTIDRVGADFVDLAVHDVGAPRRAGEVQGVRTVPIAAIRYLRRGWEGR